MDQLMHNFLKSVNVANEHDALRNSLVAAFRRNRIYENGAHNIRRQELHDRLRAELKCSGDNINESYSDLDHMKAIKSLSDRLSAEFGGILFQGRFKIGTSQKALNLYLKFKWCLSELPRPIHCPLDGIILRAAKVKGAWTKLDEIDDYMDWITSIRLFVGMDDISTWELNEWNKYAKKSVTRPSCA